MNSRLILSTKFQAPNTKQNRSTNSKKVSNLCFDFLNLFGIWNLEFGIFLLFFLLPNLIFSQNEIRKVENSTFQRGEFLKYKVYYDSWMTYYLTAGYGTLEIDPEPVSLNGRETYHVTLLGNSVGLFSFFYKVRDRFETYIDTQGLMPWKFIRSTHEGSYKREDEVLFDQLGSTAHSLRAVKEITPYVQDIVSAFYYMRTWNFDTAKVNDEYFLDFFLDDSLYHSKIIYLGREKMKTDFGELDCMKFKPMVASGDLFHEPYPAVLWVTDDNNKIPVLIRSAVFIGSVKIELVDYKGLRYPLGEKVQ